MFKKLLDSKNYWDMYIIFRWCYKIGYDVFEDTDFWDKLYDNIEIVLKKREPDSEWFKRSWADDTEPVELLEKYNINLVKFKSCNSDRITKYYDILTDNKGISVRPVRSLEEAYEWYKQHQNVQIIHSVKMNGIHTKNLVDVYTGKILVSSSKASDTDNFLDYTDAIVSKFPHLKTNRYKNIKTHKHTILPIGAEAFVDSKGIELLKKEYDINYKSARSAAMGVLQKNYTQLIKNHLRVVCFFNPDNLGTIIDGINRAEDMGFETVPRRVDVFIDTGFEDFKRWIEPIMLELSKTADEKDMPYDGIVAQINDMNEYYRSYNSMYNDSNIALKFGVTGAEIIEATVERVRLIAGDNSSVQMTPKIFIEPVITSDGNKISEISGYTLDNIIERKIHSGSKIKVAYQSGCYPTLY